MTNLMLNPPLFAFIVGTRAALAFGVGLLLASRIPEDRRKTIATTLIALGAATTIPAVLALRASRKDPMSALTQH